MLYTSQYFNITIETTKTLVKIKNNKSNNVIKLDVRVLRRFTTSTKDVDVKLIIANFMMASSFKVEHLSDEVKADTRRVNAFIKMRETAKAMEQEFYPNYSYKLLFKETLGL